MQQGCLVAAVTVADRPSWHCSGAGILDTSWSCLEGLTSLTICHPHAGFRTCCPASLWPLAAKRASFPTPSGAHNIACERCFLVMTFTSAPSSLLQAVELETQTREDAWGLRFLNVLNCLRQLTQQGLTREVFLWGLIEVRWWLWPAAAAFTMLPATRAAPKG